MTEVERIEELERKYRNLKDQYDALLARLEALENG